MASFLPWTQSYKIKHGLAFAKKMSVRTISSRMAYEELENKILGCQQGSCPYTDRELRDIVNRISPGLGMVDTICVMLDSLAKE